MSRVTYRGAADLPPLSRSSGTMAWNHTGSWRFLRPRYQDKVAPCGEACPAGEDVALVELLVGRGDFEGAWRRIREENPLPGTCGRVCFHPCEAACNRGEYDEAVAIPSLERHVADVARRQGLKPSPSHAPASGRRVAVVGAGPAGLTAACFLRRFGHQVDLFDARREPGGMLRYAIPDYRLPVETVAWEAGLVLAEGVRFCPERRLGADLGWEELGGYDAVFLAVGAWAATRLGVPGEELARDGLGLLDALRQGQRPTVAGPVAVIGGGNTALDVARALVRLGAEPTIYYRRRLADLPALPDELAEAREEGIPVRTLLTPEALAPAADGIALTLTTLLAVADPAGGRARVVPSGHPSVTVTVTAVYAAVGAGPSEGLPPELHAGDGAAVAGLHLRRVVTRGAWAERPPTYLGGDLVNDRRTVVTAIASGKEAAVVIDAELRGVSLAEVWPAIRVGKGGAISLNRLNGGDRARRQDHVVRFEELNTIYFGYQERRPRPRISLEERRTGFDEVALRISGALARQEAERCFHCGVCDQCDNCYLFCPDVSVRRDPGGDRREIDYAYCKGCGVCVVECPRNAMVLEEEPR